MKRIFALAGLVIFLNSSAAHAQFASLGSRTDLQNLSNFVGGWLEIRTVEPPSDLGGKPFGVGFGIGVGGVFTSQVQSLLTGLSLPALPAASAYVSIFGPFGIAVDFGGLPPLSFSGFSLLDLGGNLRWTISRILPDFIPVTLGANLGFTYGRVGYSTTVSAVGLSVTDTITLVTLDGMVSKELGPFEPYLAVGAGMLNSTITAVGSVSYFGYATSQTNSDSFSGFSPHGRAGFKLKFGPFLSCLEYEYAFFNHVANFKMGFRI